MKMPSMLAENQSNLSMEWLEYLGLIVLLQDPVGPIILANDACRLELLHQVHSQILLLIILLQQRDLLLENIVTGQLRRRLDFLLNSGLLFGIDLGFSSPSLAAGLEQIGRDSLCG